MNRPHAPTPSSSTTAQVVELHPTTLRAWLDAGDTVLVDVREPFEHATESIADTRLLPLSKFDPEVAESLVPAGKRLCLYCRTGRRSFDAAERIAAHGLPVAHLAGGIVAWKECEYPVGRAARAPRVDVMRQVQMVAGSLVLLGAILGFFVDPAFVFLSAFVGAGLLFAGASGWCGMAILLGKMPWNRVDAQCAVAPRSPGVDPAAGRTQASAARP